MSYWAKPVLDRNQAQLLPPTMDDLVSEGHPVHLYHEILGKLDWSRRESQYNGRGGSRRFTRACCVGRSFTDCRGECGRVGSWRMRAGIG
jgi:hypothetical protein